MYPRAATHTVPPPLHASPKWGQRSADGCPRGPHIVGPERNRIEHASSMHRAASAIESGIWWAFLGASESPSKCIDRCRTIADRNPTTRAFLSEAETRAPFHGARALPRMIGPAIADLQKMAVAEWLQLFNSVRGPMERLGIMRGPYTVSPCSSAHWKRTSGSQEI